MDAADVSLHDIDTDVTGDADGLISGDRYRVELECVPTDDLVLDLSKL
jgi:hypothetical protein